MIVFTVDRKGNHGHPTRKFGMIRRLLKQKRTKIVSRLQETILVKFLDREFDKSKTVGKIIMGLDPGYKNIGYYIIKVIGDIVFDIISGEVLTRTEKIRKLLKDRSDYRKARRQHRRQRVKRLYGSRKFRKPIWKNRRKVAFRQPTFIHLIRTHYNLIQKLRRFINIDQLNIEYFKYDSQKAMNPNISGIQYQQGPKFGYENTRSYVLDRDGYKCRACGVKDVPLITHHIIEQSDSGTDKPSNLVTVCKECHHKIHTGVISCPMKGVSKSRDSGVLNSCMKALYLSLKTTSMDVKKVYGADTKAIRNYYSIEKDHRNDALCIALRYLKQITFDDKNGVEIYFQQFRRHNRSWTVRMEDRKYYISGSRKVVARNRNRRSGQDKKKDICLTEFRQICKSKGVYIPVIAKPGGSVSMNSHKYFPDSKSNWMFRAGNVIKYNNQYKVMEYTANSQQRVYMVDGETILKFKEFVTFSQIRSKAKHIALNCGLVPL